MAEHQRKWVKKQNAICCIYKIVHTLSGRAYIGSTVDAGERWSGHLLSLMLKRGNKMMQECWDNDGPTNFSFQICEVLEKGSEDYVILLHEQQWWDKEMNPLNSRPNRRGKKERAQ